MKNLNTLFATVLAIIFTGLAISCEPISNPDPVPAVDSTKTATLSGNVFANLDQTNDTTGIREDDYEAAPNGQTIKVVLDADDFNPSANPSDKISFETTVEGSGNFSIEVPAKDGPIDAEIYMDSFMASQNTASGSEEQAYASELHPNPYIVQITANLNTFQDLYYEVQ